jgi:hypothetical protein
MAVIFDADSAFTTTDTTTTLTWAHTCTGTDLTLISTIGISQAGVVDSVTYNAVSLTKAKGIANGNTESTMWYLTAPATGANNVQVVFSTSVANRAVRAASFTNTDQTTPIGATVSQTGTAQNKSIAITTTKTGSCVIDGHGAISGAHTPTAGQTRISNTIGASNRMAGYELVSAIDTYTQTWDSTASAVYSQVAIELLDAGAAPPPPAIGVSQLLTLGVG